MQELQVYQIDESGRLIDVLMIKQGEILTEQVQIGEETVTDEEGNEIKQPIYETRPRQDIIYERPPDGLFKPTWDGTEWVNGLTQEEIDAIREQQEQEAREQEKRRQKEAQLVEKAEELERLNIDTMLALTVVFEENLQLKAKNEELEQQNIDTMIALTDVYEQLLLLTNGGES